MDSWKIEVSRLSPEERIREGEDLIMKIESAPVKSWGRLRALYRWSTWVREHGPALLRFARRCQRERDTARAEVTRLRNG